MTGDQVKMPDKMEALADSIFDSVKTYLARALSPLMARVYDLEKRAPIQGKDGKDGIDGKDGLNGTNGRDGTDGRDGKDGVDGKDGLPGKDGVDGKDGDKGRDGVDGREGKDGKDGINGKDGLPGKDGIDGKNGTDGREGVDGLAGRDGQDGIDGKDGRDGVDGRDALDTEVVKDPDMSRGYRRGTWASYKGGIIKAVRNTDPVTGSLGNAGWEVMLNGIAAVAGQQVDYRNAVLRCTTTDGTVAEVPIKVAAMVFRGVWKAGQFEVGDTVLRDGSLWHCDKLTEGMPGACSDWTLCTKRGQNGKDGKDGKDGARGPEGPRGRDLTQIAPDGSKF